MVSVKEKIAYGLGDTASNIVFQTVMLFLTFFLYRHLRHFASFCWHYVSGCAYYRRSDRPY